MTKVQRPLSVLGLPDGASEADIRRAYAQRLKTTHPEDDPEGFKQLRLAYEAALNEARWCVQFGDNEPVGDEDEAPTETEAGAGIFEEPFDPAGAAEAGPIPFAAIGGGPARSGEEEAHAASCNRLGDALQNGARLEELHAALDAVLVSSALAKVDVYSRTESWLVYILTSMAPKSYPLLDRVIAHFQWDRHIADHRNTGPSAVLAMRDRIPGDKAAAEFLKRVSDRRHEFHRAYKETMRDPYERNWLSRFWSLRRYDLMERFIVYIDRRVPLAIEQLNGGAVFWWRNVRRGPMRWFLAASAFAQAGLYLAVVVAGAFLFLRGLGVPELFGTPIFVQPPAADAVWLGPRAECERAMANLGSEGSNRSIETAIAEADRPCRRELAAAPNSLVLSQHVGVIALAAGRPEEARERFESILALSPNDPYALFGKGLAVSDALLTGEAVKREPGVLDYFLAFPIRVPAPTPFEGQLKSRWEKRPNPRIDTRMKKMSGASEEDIRDLLKRFGRRQTPGGEALLDCLVGADGVVSECVIVREAPLNQGVGEFALGVAAASEFEPARLNGEPVDRVPVTYTITLGDGWKGATSTPGESMIGEFLEGLRKTGEKPAAAASARPSTAPSAARAPSGIAPRALSEETQRMSARNECEVRFEEFRSPKPGQNIGQTMAHADEFCRREIGKAPDSLMLRQHVAMVALGTGKMEEAAQLFDEVLAISPNDPYALYGRGIATFNLDSSADLSIMAEAQKREPEVKAYFSKLPVTIPDVAPQEEEPMSRSERRRTPQYDTQMARIGEASDQELRDLLMHFGVERTPVGEAQLNCLVGADGGVSDCVILKETPFNRGVGEFALRMAMLSTFEPARLNGEAVDRVPLTYTIRLVQDPAVAAPK